MCALMCPDTGVCVCVCVCVCALCLEFMKSCRNCANMQCFNALKRHVLKSCDVLNVNTKKNLIQLHL